MVQHPLAHPNLCLGCKSVHAFYLMQLWLSFSMQLDAILTLLQVTIHPNTDIGSFTLGDVLKFVGQFIDGTLASTIVYEEGEWKVNPDQPLASIQIGTDLFHLRTIVL